MLLLQYARRVDASLRPVLAGRAAPLILAATESLGSHFRSVSPHPGLADAAIAGNPDRTSAADLAAAARPILDGLYARDLDALRETFARRRTQC